MTKLETVDRFIEEHPNWKVELIKLRNLFLSYPLEETIKWGGPVYTMHGKNLFGLGAFKNHYSIWFFQGVLLEKNTDLLVNAQEGKTQSMRQIKMDKSSEVNFKELANYIEETIDNHKQGRRISPLQKREVLLAEELKIKFKEDQDFEKSFKNLTPGKQREYSEYITQAKKEETRYKRLEKIIPMVKSGIGLNDKYKNC